MPTTLSSKASAPAPEWALRQRSLIAQMNENALRYQERYTRKDGSFVWRDEWPGFDGLGRCGRAARA
ncbi:MAG: hypothetical protein ACYC6L_09080 [Anaerolineae bacterium]